MDTRMQWHGTPTEALELVHALSRYCSCVFSAEFSRRIVGRLRTEEFHLSETTTREVVERSWTNQLPSKRAATHAYQEADQWQQ
jgi:hypothetical protein